MPYYNKRMLRELPARLRPFYKYNKNILTLHELVFGCSLFHSFLTPKRVTYPVYDTCSFSGSAVVPFRLNPVVRSPLLRFLAELLDRFLYSDYVVSLCSVFVDMWGIL